MVDGHCIRTTHTEANAIVQEAKNDVKVNPVNNIGELDENIPMLGQQRRIVRLAYEIITDVGDI